MISIFRKKMKPDELFEKVMAYEGDNETIISLLSTVLRHCKGKYQSLGHKVISEKLKRSKDPIGDLKKSLVYIRDHELAEVVVDKIAGYGMENQEVHRAIYIIGTSPENKAAKKRARAHYDQYYYQVTGGNPLRKPDLLIPEW
jgi:hypothetical protein